MKSVSVLLYLSVLVVGNASSNVNAKDTARNFTVRYGHLNVLMEDLQGLVWTDDEGPCLEQLLRIIINVQNSTLWATWIWDSIQTPVGHLYGSRNNYGNYDECLDFPWEKVHADLKTQYCLAHIRLSDVDSQGDDVDLFGTVRNYIRTKTKRHLKFNSLTWGVCTPAICKSHSVANFVGVLFRHSHLGLAVDKPNISVSDCDVAGDTQVDVSQYLVGCFIVFMLCWTLICTLYVNYMGADKTSYGMDFLKSFHISTNVQTLIKITDNDIRPMFGIRVISFFNIILLHSWLLTNSMGVINGIGLNKNYESLWIFLPNLEIAVDTFFFMSGLFLIKGLMHNGLKTFNPFKPIVKRYFRLASLIVITLLLFENFPIRRSPVKKLLYDKEMKHCNKNWWTTILMIQTFIDTENMCCPSLWSVQCDFHLSIIGTIIAWVLQKSRRVGLIIFSASFIASVAFPALFIYKNTAAGIIYYDFRFTDNYRNHVIASPLYTSTHLRAGSYLVGMAMGYWISLYNPVFHRNILSKKYSVLCFCGILAMFLGFFMTSYLMLKREPNIVEVIIYVSLKRVVWAMLIGLLVMVCEYGTLPLVTSFLSWSAWAPLSRLSYGIYLVHPGLIVLLLISNGTPPQHDLYNEIMTASAVTIISSISSLFLWTLFEAPGQNIMSLILKTRNNISHNVQEAKKQI